MNASRSRMLGLISIGLATGLIQTAEAASLPNSEELTYKVTWRGLPAGTIKQDLEKTADGTYRLTVTAISNRMVNLFYHLDSQQTSVFKVREDGLQELHYKHISKGKEAFPRDVRFDWHAKLAHLKNEDGQRDIPLSTNMLDPNALNQQLRFFPDSIGAPFVSVDGKSTKHIQVRNMGIHSIDTPAGEFEAQCLEQVDAKQTDPEKKRAVSICYSNDARRLPVEIRLHSRYGDIIAHLAAVKQD